MMDSVSALAAPPAIQVASELDGSWQLAEDDSDDVMREWHRAVRDQIKRDARRTSSSSPMAQPANPGQHIRLPYFLATYRTVRFTSTPDQFVIEQSHMTGPGKTAAVDRIRREVNLNPEAMSISLREAARKPPTMYIGGWEKGALVIETTTDEGMIIEERWRVVRDDDETILQRTILLRSSIWGDRTFQQQFEKVPDEKTGMR